MAVANDFDVLERYFNCVSNISLCHKVKGPFEARMAIPGR